jgi:toxin ParE1/3/4
VALDLVYLPGADADLDRIYHWLAPHAGAADALAYLNRIEAACQRLTEFPRRGSPHAQLGPGLRSIPFERRATIYYRLAGPAVEIVRILHRGLDAGREFQAG